MSSFIHSHPWRSSNQRSQFLPLTHFSSKQNLLSVQVFNQATPTRLWFHRTEILNESRAKTAQAHPQLFAYISGSTVECGFCARYAGWLWSRTMWWWSYVEAGKCNLVFGYMWVCVCVCINLNLVCWCKSWILVVWHIQIIIH